MICKRFSKNGLKSKTSEKTCIARQKILAIGPDVPGYKRIQYNDCMKCGGCEQGIDLYKKSLQEKKAMKEKICSKCGKPKPADLDHFDGANRSKDKLTNVCKVCRAIEAAMKKSPDPANKTTTDKQILQEHAEKKSQEFNNINMAKYNNA